MRATIAAALFALTAGTVSAATIDLAARDRTLGPALTEDQHMSVDLTDAFGFLMGQAITNGDNPRAMIDLVTMDMMPLPGDLTLGFAPRLTGDSTAPALMASGLEYVWDTTGAAMLFTVTAPSDAVPGVDLRATLYAVLKGSFGIYAGGDWTGDGRFSLYTTEIAPIPLPAGAVLLITGLGALAAMRRRRG
ncbi:MAG: VPLPA-CTERM sorting domain-containing protein [Paracoccus sp. (in: a-proteobacteria)]|nr:VPLPA-CTERM sorting domain-containing protein [Paracoccus sp. (in: a-proteobacteria)]